MNFRERAAGSNTPVSIALKRLRSVASRKSGKGLEVAEDEDRNETNFILTEAKKRYVKSIKLRDQLKSQESSRGK